MRGSYAVKLLLITQHQPPPQPMTKTLSRGVFMSKMTLIERVEAIPVRHGIVPKSEVDDLNRPRSPEFSPERYSRSSYAVKLLLTFRD